MKTFIFCLVTVFFIISPFEQGLYFDEGFYAWQVYILVLFSVMFIALLLKKELYIMRPVWFIVLLPFCYLISMFIAENPMGAWNSLLRWTTYVAFFLLLIWSTYKQKKIQQLLPIIFTLMGITIGVHMILSHFEWIEYPNSHILGRFAGVFQYPNTFGMVMIVFYLFSLIQLIGNRSNKILFFIYSFPLVIFLVCFFESYSRGMYFVFPIAWFIGLVFMNSKDQINYIIYSTFSIVFALFGFSIMQRMSTHWTFISLIGISILMVILTILINHLISTRKSSFIKLLEKKRWVIPVLIIVIASLFILDISFKGLAYQQFPEPIQERISSINDSSTARERTLFIEDAYNMSKDSPLIGFGGDGWESIYTSYQQLPYQSNKIHNELLEFVIDIGWIGLFVFLAIFSLLVAKIVKNYKTSDDKNNHKYTAVLVTLIVIILHSLIDFNFAYGTIVLFIMWLMVIGLSSNTVVNLRTDKKNIFQFGVYTYTALVLLTLVFSYRFMQADISFTEAKQTRNPVDKEYYLENAVSKNPYHFEYLYTLSQLKFQLSKEEEVINLVNEIVELEPNNSRVRFLAATLYQQVGKEELARENLKVTMELDRYFKEAYEAFIKLNVSSAEKTKDKSKVNGLLEDAINAYDNITATYDEFYKNPIGGSHNSRDFRITEEMKSHIESAERLKENVES